MRIWGIDCDSKKIAIVCFEDKRLKNWVFMKSNEQKVDERIFDLYQGFDKILETQPKPDKIIIEESLFLNNFWSSRVITEIIGDCKLCCKLHSVPVETVINSSWKKVVIGKGNATKKQIEEFAIEKFSELIGEEQDVLDASCIGLWGVMKYEE